MNTTVSREVTTQFAVFDGRLLAPFFVSYTVAFGRMSSNVDTEFRA